MGVWDDVKDILKNIRLVEVKQNINLYGDINLPLKGDTIHYSVPESARMRISSSGVTPEMEKEYEIRVHENIKAKESVLAGLPEEQRKKLIAESTVATALDVLSEGPSDEEDK